VTVGKRERGEDRKKEKKEKKERERDKIFHHVCERERERE
jgi:hypothetical protein